MHRNRKRKALLLPLFLLVCTAFPLGAADWDVFDSAIRIVQDRYFYLESVTSESMLEGAVERLCRKVEWLMADVDGNQARLWHGDGTPIGTVTVGDLADLPRAMRELRDLVSAQPYPQDPDLDLDVQILKGAMATLDHPSTVLYGHGLESFDQRIKGTLTGIGARIGKDDFDILIRSVFADGPADKGGVQAGDIVLRINGVSTLGMSVSDAVERIRGPESTPVVLLVRRGDEQIRLPLVRARVKIPNLEYRVLDSGAGYISISHFSEQTVENLRQALEDLSMAGALVQGLVMDLRGNTGGSLIQAARSADQFLKEGQLVRTVGRDGAPVSNLIRQMNADDEGTEPSVPLVLLTDPKTASGSEILAGALTLLDRGIIVGERTYGKGSVQKIYNLRRDLRIKLTVAEYLLAGDVSVAHKGLEPDISVGVAVFDRNGVRIKEPDNHLEHVLFAEERPGWRKEGQDPPAAEDPTLALAERILLQAESPLRQDLLATACSVAETVGAEQDRRLVETFALAGIDWSPAPAEGPIPTVETELSTLTPPRAGESVELRLRVKNMGKAPLFRVRARLYSENETWDGIYIPVGRLEPGQAGEGWRVVTISPLIPERTDDVTIVIEADGRTSAPPERVRLHTSARPVPLLSIAAHLVPAGESRYKAELTIDNRGKGTLQDLQVRFDFPADQAIELLDPEVLLPTLEPGESSKVSLGLALRSGVEHFPDGTLPLTIKINAALFGSLFRWDFPLPLDGSSVFHEPPWFHYKGPLLANADEWVKLSFQAYDDRTVDHIVVYSNGKKIAYAKGRSHKLDLSTRLPVDAGSNAITAFAEDDQGHRTRYFAYILGLAPTPPPLSMEPSPSTD